MINVIVNMIQQTLITRTFNALRRKSNFITIVILLLLTLYPLVVAYNYPHAHLGDDAFITLTYSKNIARGNGFVFNHPPAVLGTTTPLFAIIIALLSVVLSQIDMRIITVFFSAACWIGIVYTFFLFRKAWGFTKWQAYIIAFVIIGLGLRTWLQMEAYLFAFLLTLSFSLFYSRHYTLSGFTTGLLFLTRGEGILLLPIFLVSILIKRLTNKVSTKILIKNSLEILAGFSIIAVIWFIFANYTFGSFLPNTLSAKRAQGLAAMQGLTAPTNVFLYHLTTRWINLWIERYSLLILISMIGLIGSFVKNRKHLIWAGWIGSYIAGYSLLNPPGYPWYQLPILFVIKIFISLGLIEILGELFRKARAKNLIAIPLLILTVPSLYLVARPVLNYKPWIGDNPRGKSYIILSQWFRDNAKKNESVAFIEIGYLGYYTDNRIIDLAGLILPDIVPYVAKGDFSSSFWRYNPDYYVYLPDFDWALAGIRANPRFDLEYQAVATLPGPGKNDFTIYKRRPLPTNN